MFNQRDIGILLGSAYLPVDLVDLRRHTNYEGLYNDAEATIMAFWKVCAFSETAYRDLTLKSSGRRLF
jgi:hypothetical protein